MSGKAFRSSNGQRKARRVRHHGEHGAMFFRIGSGCQWNICRQRQMKYPSHAMRQCNNAGLAEAGWPRPRQ
jgi:hypothetical protein